MWRLQAIAAPGTSRLDAAVSDSVAETFFGDACLARELPAARHRGQSPLLPAMQDTQTIGALFLGGLGLTALVFVILSWLGILK